MEWVLVIRRWPGSGQTYVPAAAAFRGAGTPEWANLLVQWVPVLTGRQLEQAIPAFPIISLQPFVFVCTELQRRKACEMSYLPDNSGG